MGTSRADNLLAGQLVNTMYEVTVSSVDAVGPLRVVAAPGVTHARRRGGGGHCGQTGNARITLFKVNHSEVKCADRCLTDLHAD